MKYLKAPWRWDFLSGAIRDRKKCVFCEALREDPDHVLVCCVGKRAFVMLNKYPYNNGHLLILPKEHLSSPLTADPAVMDEMWSLMIDSLRVLEKVFAPDGFNTGMNLGRAAGAGIEDHFHLHVVPRWQGDANFMPIIGQTDVVSYDIKKIHRLIRNGFLALREKK